MAVVTHDHQLLVVAEAEATVTAEGAVTVVLDHLPGEKGVPTVVRNTRDLDAPLNTEARSGVAFHHHLPEGEDVHLPPLREAQMPGTVCLQETTNRPMGLIQVLGEGLGAGV